MENLITYLFESLSKSLVIDLSFIKLLLICAMKLNLCVCLAVESV